MPESTSQIMRALCLGAFQSCHPMLAESDFVEPVRCGHRWNQDGYRQQAERTTAFPSEAQPAKEKMSAVSFGVAAVLRRE